MYCVRLDVSVGALQENMIPFERAQVPYVLTNSICTLFISITEHANILQQGLLDIKYT